MVVTRDCRGLFFLFILGAGDGTQGFVYAW
jgi:hypothetical protein